MTDDKKKERKIRVLKMIRIWQKMFPHPQSELHYHSHWEFLFAVILSAQCTDKRVNQVTKKLFVKYPRLQDYAGATQEEFERDIFSTGFYRMKAKYIIATAKILLSQYNGQLPRTLSELQQLPGVGRKTANVVLSNLFGINEGIAIDTHAIRLSKKLDLADPPFTAISIERDLLDIVPKKHWGNMNHYFVLYGRYHAPAHKRDINDELSII